MHVWLDKGMDGRHGFVLGTVNRVVGLGGAVATHAGWSKARMAVVVVPLLLIIGGPCQRQPEEIPVSAVPVVTRVDDDTFLVEVVGTTTESWDFMEFTAFQPDRTNWQERYISISPRRCMVERSGDSWTESFRGERTPSDRTWTSTEEGESTSCVHDRQHGT